MGLRDHDSTRESSAICARVSLLNIHQTTYLCPTEIPLQLSSFAICVIHRLGPAEYVLSRQVQKAETSRRSRVRFENRVISNSGGGNSFAPRTSISVPRDDLRIVESKYFSPLASIFFILRVPGE